MKATILGCGPSAGVPRVGDDWGTLNPANPKNRRRRASIVVETAERRFLVDTSPDLREQLLDNNIAHVDAVIWTHDHADHCHGIDDVRALAIRNGAPIDAYARPYTRDALVRRFDYAFEGKEMYPALMDLHLLPDVTDIFDVMVSAVDMPHGSITSAGLVFEKDGKRVGYATDFNPITDAMTEHFADLDLFIVDAMRRKPHPLHPTLDMILNWVAEIKPKRTIITHMDSTMDYDQLVQILPNDVSPAYDMMVVEV